MEQNEVILGVDTHLDAHVGAVISETGRLLGTLSVSADTAGYLKLLTWANSHGHLCRAGVEETGNYGAGLARALRDHDIEVLEVNRPDRAARRSRGKSDPTDAESAARAVLAGKATAIPKEQSGVAEAMRAVSVGRRSAVKAKTQAINQLRAVAGERATGYSRAFSQDEDCTMHCRLRTSALAGGLPPSYKR